MDLAVNGEPPRAVPGRRALGGSVPGARGRPPAGAPGPVRAPAADVRAGRRLLDRGVRRPVRGDDSSRQLRVQPCAEPFLTPVSITLDALDQDAEGRITCYARISDDHSRSSPRGIVRRRVVGRDGGTHDEAFARNLRWKPTEHLRLRSEGHNDVDHVRISGREAAAFIESVTERLAGTP